MTQNRCWSLVAPLALIAGLAAGCSPQGGTTVGDESSSDPASEAANVADKADLKVDRKADQGRGFDRHVGPEKMFRAALDGLGLSADQKKVVDQALGSAFPAKDANEGQMKPFFTMLSEQIRAGAIDERALTAKLGELKGGRGDQRAKTVAAFQAIHDTLTSDQRSALVTTLEGQFAAHDPGDKDKGRADKDHDRADKRDHGRGGMHGPLGFMLHGVDVDDAQREKIVAALEAADLGMPDKNGMGRDHAGMKDKMKAALEAFKQDRFDAGAVLPEKGEGPEHLEKMVRAMGVIVPLLNTEQREALAKNIEDGPRMFGKHGPGARGHARPGNDEAE